MFLQRSETGLRREAGEFGGLEMRAEFRNGTVAENTISNQGLMARASHRELAGAGEAWRELAKIGSGLAKIGSTLA